MIPLHLHTSGSELDGSIDIKKLIQRVKDMNLDAVAITDHGNMIKAFEFQEECLANNIKPIIGCEMYMGEPESKDTFHILLLAKTNQGVKSLYKLNKKAYMNNFYKKPRITFHDLCIHKEGLIVTTACLGSEFGQLFFQDKSLTELVEKFKQVFGDDFFLELQPNSIPKQAEYNKKLLEISETTGVKCIITNDAHYIHKEDAKSHDVLLCMQTKKKIDDPNRFKFDGEDFYLMTQDEVKNKLLQQGISERDIAIALTNTQQVANKCNGLIETGLDLYPTVQEGLDESHELARLCNKGYVKRFGKTKREDVIQRVKYELSVIKEKGYCGYFLIVEDFIRWAKENGIMVGAGRGSAAGCMVAYLLGITNVDPIEHGLLFERFLNPDRNSDPDIDVDFDYNRRNEVIQYVKDKYGADKVAHIMAEGTLTLKSVIRKVLSVYDYPQKYINQITKPIDNSLKTLEEAYAMTPSFREQMDANQEQYKVMQDLEGLMSHVSTHAAGIVISPIPLDEVMPVMRDSDDHTMLKTQWSKKPLEKLGALKFDFLGLKTLTIIADTIKSIKKNYNVDLNIDDIDYNDPKIYEVLNSGDLCGIFQFSEPSGKQAIQAIQPTTFEDIVAGEALCRPGVKEKDLYLAKTQNIQYEHPIIEEILSPTHGAIVYQEQTMLLMNRLTGGRWTLGFADKMRKVKDLEEYREQFVRDCAKNNIDPTVSNNIYSRFDLGYSFNKSHAVSYAIITAITAYLKGHYRKEFMASVLSMEMQASKPMETIPIIIRECEKYGIKILPPDINKSGKGFEPTAEGIVYPLRAIDKVGDKVVEAILSERSNGEFTSLQNFTERVPKRHCNKRVVESLIKSGCFDLLDTKNRNLLLEEYSNLIGKPKKYECWSDEFLMRYEMETVGMYLTKHPLDHMPKTNFDISEDGKDCGFYGLISNINVVFDKNQNQMAFVTVQSKQETVECIMFSNIYKSYKKYLIKNLPVTIRGRKDGNKILVDEVRKLA